MNQVILLALRFLLMVGLGKFKLSKSCRGVSYLCSQQVRDSLVMRFLYFYEESTSRAGLNIQYPIFEEPLADAC